MSTPKHHFIKHLNHYQQDSCFASSRPQLPKTDFKNLQTRCSHKKHSSKNSNSSDQPYQDLIKQLQSQINALGPVRNSMANLSFYYQKLNSNYEDLLIQMQESHYPISFNRTKQIQRTQLNDKLRELQMEYEQLSDYLNQHLIPEKLQNERKSNRDICERFNQLQQEFIQNKTIATINLQLKQKTCSELEKLEQQKLYAQQSFKKSQQRLQNALVNLNSIVIDKQATQKHMNNLKKHQMKSYQKQCILLKEMISCKKQMEILSKLNEQTQSQYTHSLTLNQSLKKIKDNSKSQLEQIYVIKNRTFNQLTVSNHQSDQLLSKIASLSGSISLNSCQLNQVQGQNLKLAQSLESSRDQLQNSSKFYQYLQSYLFQLQQSSTIMFGKLQQSCISDCFMLEKRKLIQNSKDKDRNVFIQENRQLIKRGVKGSIDQQLNGVNKGIIDQKVETEAYFEQNYINKMHALRDLKNIYV